MKKVLVEVDEEQWRKMKGRAGTLGVPLPDVVARAFRLYLSDDGTEGGAGEGRARVTGEVTGRGSLAALHDQLNAKHPGAVMMGRALTDPHRASRGDESGSQIRDDEDIEPIFEEND